MADKVKLIRAKTERLSDIAIENGQIIITVDSSSIYMDFDGMRLRYGIKALKNDAERLSLSPQQGRYYYTLQENVMWYYGDSWKQLTPSNLMPIVFLLDESDLPEEGDESVLYTIQDVILRYDRSLGDYYVVSNRTAWESM